MADLTSMWTFNVIDVETANASPFQHLPGWDCQYPRHYRCFPPEQPSLRIQLKPQSGQRTSWR